LIEDESGEELEEINKLILKAIRILLLLPPPSSSDEQKIEIEFCHRRETDTASIHDFTGLPNGIQQSAAPSISSESSPFAVVFLFFHHIFVTLLTETN
jgi:hypothetical protein